MACTVSSKTALRYPTLRHRQNYVQNPFDCRCKRIFLTTSDLMDFYHEVYMARTRTPTFCRLRNK